MEFSLQRALLKLDHFPTLHETPHNSRFTSYMYFLSHFYLWQWQSRKAWKFRPWSTDTTMKMASRPENLPQVPSFNIYKKDCIATLSLCCTFLHPKFFEIYHSLYLKENWRKKCRTKPDQFNWPQLWFKPDLANMV